MIVHLSITWAKSSGIALYVPAVNVDQSSSADCAALLQALKERLVERANIIQARHDAETAALVKRQVSIQQQ